MTALELALLKRLTDNTWSLCDERFPAKSSVHPACRVEKTRYQKQILHLMKIVENALQKPLCGSQVTNVPQVTAERP